jgi:hypothetical protein
MSGQRRVSDVARNPIPRDAIEIREGEGEESHDVMLRILAVVDEHVGYKQYGKGRFWCSLASWKSRLEAAVKSEMIFDATSDMPF